MEREGEKVRRLWEVGGEEGFVILKILPVVVLFRISLSS
jgi:hypothetical protein